MNESLREFGRYIDQLIAGRNLTRMESRDLFAQVLSDDQTDIHQGAFLSAITAKGPTPQEIAGAWQAIFEMDTVKVLPETSKPLVDNCGTGMDAFKTFNISTGAAIVASAGGVCVARHGARAITSGCGTVDLCESLGADVECGPEIVRESIEKTGLGLFNGMSSQIHPRALFRILSRMRFGSILNIAASLANPVRPLYGVRGVYAPALVIPVLEAMREIGFVRAMVFHGLLPGKNAGIDELSPVAESLVAELNADGKISSYRLEPRSLGVEYDEPIDAIAGCGGPQEEALRLLGVFSGKERSALYQTICLNAAPLFYVSSAVSDLKEGFEKARKVIDSGQAMNQVFNWVQAQNRNPEQGRVRMNQLLAML